MDEKKINVYEKEIHPDLNSLSHFKAREKKKTHRGLNSLPYFRTHEKEVHPDPNSLSHFKAREKRPIEVLIRFLVSKLMKKGSPGPEKKTHPGLFFNLRLRKASKPLRERV